MIEWTYSRDGHAATLDTQLAQLRITADIAHSAPDAIRYRGQVCNRVLYILRERGALATMDAAQTWCLAAYRALLAVELRGIE